MTSLENFDKFGNWKSSNIIPNTDKTESKLMQETDSKRISKQITDSL